MPTHTGEQEANPPLEQTRTDVKGTNPRWPSAAALSIIEELHYLAHVAGPRAGRRRGYAFPSTSYLARKAGVTRWTVSRITSRLELAGALRKVHRRKHRERFQTVLYTTIASEPLALNRVRLYIAAQKRRPRPHHHGPRVAPAPPAPPPSSPCALNRSPSGIGESRERSPPRLTGYLAERFAVWTRRAGEKEG